VDVRENSFAYLTSDTSRTSPAADDFRSGKPVRTRLDRNGATMGSAMLDGLVAEGFTDFYAGPLRFISGQVHANTFATRAPEGFTDEHIAAIDRLLRPLSRIAEIFALSRTAVNLLNTYVGHNAGERILSGQIQRGETTTIRAVIWFSDLRGFTSLTGILGANEIVHVLNELFDAQVPCIEKHGGEVLKFMGDGLLAIFPVSTDEASVRARCDAALDAARESFETLATINAKRAERQRGEIRFGLALHVGDIAYGNIGGSGRLDFTCIGPAVNVAARLESLTSKLGRTLVTSAEFARYSSKPLSSLGRFELKGVAGDAEVFEPA
jgi:adenylate cyclase